MQILARSYKEKVTRCSSKQQCHFYSLQAILGMYMYYNGLCVLIATFTYNLCEKLTVVVLKLQSGVYPYRVGQREPPPLSEKKKKICFLKQPLYYLLLAVTQQVHNSTLPVSVTVVSKLTRSSLTELYFFNFPRVACPQIPLVRACNEC